jgi:hypothetical protein
MVRAVDVHSIVLRAAAHVDDHRIVVVFFPVFRVEASMDLGAESTALVVFKTFR